MRGQPSQGAAIDVADVVDAGLQRAKVHAAQLFPYGRNAFKREAPQFDLLPRSDVENAVAQPPRQVRYRAQLSAGHKSVGHAHAHHELAGRRAAEKHPDPFQQFLFGGRESRGAAFYDFRQAFADTKSVAVHGRFVAFDGVRSDGRARLQRNLLGFGIARTDGDGQLQNGLLASQGKQPSRLVSALAKSTHWILARPGANTATGGDEACHRYGHFW